MKRAKLAGMASAYEAILTLPINQHPPAHEMIATLMDAEVQHRAQRRMELFLRTSRLRYRATLTDIQCSEERNLQPQTLAQLADDAYLNRAENILITGATGCGKSFLACALGHQACANGHRTLYFNLNWPKPMERSSNGSISLKKHNSSSSMILEYNPLLSRSHSSCSKSWKTVRGTTSSDRQSV